VKSVSEEEGKEEASLVIQYFGVVGPEGRAMPYDFSPGKKRTFKLFWTTDQSGNRIADTQLINGDQVAMVLSTISKSRGKMQPSTCAILSNYNHELQVS
jgi:hypothetical protein